MGPGDTAQLLPSRDTALTDKKLPHAQERQEQLLEVASNGEDEVAMVEATATSLDRNSADRAEAGFED